MNPTRTPIPFDAEAGSRAVEACHPPADWAEVVRGAGGSSPYLSGLLAREAEWLAGVWDADPLVALSNVLEGLTPDSDPKRALRIAKRRVALLVALADLGGVWTTMQATDALTRFAETALDVALRYELGRQKGLPDDPGLVAMAMGKMGAHELNYSSDIDVVLLFDQARHDPADYATVRAALIKAARRAVAQMTENTADGYVFRTDLRLRPDPSSTPIVVAMEAAERYYEGLGRAWERAAWIKARPAAGDLAAGEAFLDTLTPFVWRRHLDFAAVEDAHAMRLGIRAHKELRAEWEVPGHDLKLGQGGIREIEFFTQTRQLIAGGRDKSLRVRGTLPGLDALQAAGWVPEDAVETLKSAYLVLRDAEHRVQMIADAQTHLVPKTPEGLARLACLSGEADPDRYAEHLREVLAGVEQIVDPFFAPDAPAPAQTAEVPGLADAEARWRSFPALRSERAQRHFERLRPRLLGGLQRAADVEEALRAFEGFLSGLPAGVQVFSLFEANPQLIELVTDICAIAPALAQYLSRNAAVFDTVLDGTFFAPLGQFEPPETEGDFETRLEALRIWHREAHFRISVHLLRGLAAPVEAAEAYARLAEAALAAAWQASGDEMARRYGRVPGLRMVGLGMGSLGAGLLHSSSDLDLVLIHSGGQGASDGRRSLEPGQWAAKFTQTLITALTAQMGPGRLYEVDMRLRPSGRQGPVATSLAAFRAYQAEEAWVWEHLALTRARPVVGDADLCAEVEAARCAVLAAGRYPPEQVVAETATMLERLPPGGEAWHLRDGPGRLRQIELVSQAHALIGGTPACRTQDQLAQAGWLAPDLRETLKEAHSTLFDLNMLLRLVGPGAEVPGQGAADLICKQAGVSDLAAAEGVVSAQTDRAAAAIALAFAADVP